MTDDGFDKWYLENLVCPVDFGELSYRDRKLVSAAGRVLKPGGAVKIQVANKYGFRSLQHQWKRGFGEPVSFQARYYSVSQRQKFFTDAIGPTTIVSDCCFCLGWQFSDNSFMRAACKPILIASEALRRLSLAITPLVQVSNSVFCTTRKR